MNTKIVKNKNRIKITYTDGKDKWFGEMTRDGMKRGLGWNQWGASEDKLWSTVSTTEKLTSEWYEEYCGDI